jgi:YegS/Rv2252/BmrU family lipid kinase
MRIRIIANFQAGTSRLIKENLDDAQRMCLEWGHTAEITATAAPLDGVRLAKEAAEKEFEMVVAAGGDGTVNEVVNGLAGSGTVLGVIPLGTENIFARDLGIPPAIKDACRVLLEGEVRRFDLGRIGERHFICMAGAGMDAEVVARVEKKAKGVFGSFAYAYTAFQFLSRYRGFHARILVDGNPLDANAWLVLVGNIKSYGWRLRITPHAVPDDGFLDLCVMPKVGFAKELCQIGKIFIGTHAASPEVSLARGREITVETRLPVRVHVDGEDFCTTPVTITAVPDALSVAVPR